MTQHHPSPPTRREMLKGTIALVAGAALASLTGCAHSKDESPMSMHAWHHGSDHGMNTVTTKDGAKIFYKDWGTGQPIVFSHGWPLSADEAGMRRDVLRHARLPRSSPTTVAGTGDRPEPWTGNDMDTYAEDLLTLTEHLDLKNAIHVGHSTGGGEVAHYVGKYGYSGARAHGRVAKMVLIGAVPPLMLKTPSNPGGTPMEVFDNYRKAAPGRSRPAFHRYPHRPVLRIQPPDPEEVARHHRQLVSPGHDVRTQSRLRLR